jgi:predicted secreted Zn-dependent protease
MKTIKQLALAAAVLAVPFMAQAELKAMDDSALATVSGQAGISISGDFSGSIGSIAWNDDGGDLRLETIAFSGFEISNDSPLKVDVGDGALTGGGTVKQLQITLPEMTGQLSVAAIKVGATTAASLGGVTISNVDMGGTTINVWGH